MTEVRAVPTRLVAVSTFSGGGGSSTGLRMAGVKPLWANEFVLAARETYSANWPDTIVSGDDIRTVTGSAILAAIGAERGEVDILEGSPPCASFSTAGKREKGWGKVSAYSDTEQRTDDLFFEFTRLVSEIRPRAFIAENVSGLVKGSAKGYFKLILAAFAKCGYQVRAQLLDAQWLGVPQARKRIIFVGIRNDLGLTPTFPKPLAYRFTVADAISDLACPVAIGTAPPHAVFLGNQREIGSTLVPSDRPSPTAAVDADTIDPETGKNISIRRGVIFPEWLKLKQGGTSDRYYMLSRAAMNAPAPTVTASAGGVTTAGVTHPLVARKFTLAELRRICSFPDDYILTGTYEQRWERLGRSVPPVMMAAIASTLADQLCVG